MITADKIRVRLLARIDYSEQGRVDNVEPLHASQRDVDVAPSNVVETGCQGWGDADCIARDN